MSTDNETVQLQISFKGGAQITVDVTDWELVKSIGRVTNLKWTTPEDAKRRLVRVDPDEVVAVVEIRP